MIGLIIPFIALIAALIFIYLLDLFFVDKIKLFYNNLSDASIIKYLIYLLDNSSFVFIILIDVLALIFRFYGIIKYSIPIYCGLLIILFLALLINIFVNFSKFKYFKIILFNIISGFICVIYIFASVYYYIYYAHPTYFSIDTKILDSKFINTYQQKYDELRLLNREMFFMALIQEKSDTMYSGIINFQGLESRKYKLLDNYFVSFTYYLSPGLTGDPSVPVYGLNFYDSTEIRTEFHEIQWIDRPGLFELFNSKNERQYYNNVNNVINWINRKQRDKAIELNLLIKNEANLEFVDFLYFSTITITTTGYGDITPNHSTVRLWVIIQTLFGVFCITSLFAKITYVESK